jgi:hypothetical protein
MSTWINVARYHLVDRISYLVMPWGILAFGFVVSLVIFALTPSHGAHAHPGSLAIIYLLFFVLGSRSVSRSLPFALTLGVTRRSYYTGTGLLAITLAALDGLVLAMLQVAERATGGWGMNVHVFRVSYILQGPWYLTWLTSFVGLALLFVYGMWFGIVYRRWNLIGTTTFIAAQITALLAGILATTRAHAWPGVGRFFTDLTPAGLTGVFAALAVVLLAGGYATIRRATV